MATQNSTNTKVTNNADGFDVAGGTTPRKLTLLGGDVAVVGSGAAVITFPTSTSTLTSGTGTSNEITYWSGTNTLASLAVATYPSLTELSYVKGVTSAIQTQLNAKQASDAQLTSVAGLLYTGNALKVVRVNAGETDFELATVSGGSPGGSDTQFQYNNGGAFGGIANLTFSDTSGAVTFAGSTDTTQLIFKANATQGVANPIFQFTNSSGTELARLGFHTDSTIGFGYLALDALTTGVDNVAIGKNAMTSAQSTQGSIAIGTNALATGTASTVNLNVAIGTGAMRYVTGAGEAIAIGSGAMGGNGTYTGADWSIAIGTDALSGTTTTGAQNVAIGRRAGVGITTGNLNVLIGSRVAESLTSGAQNIGIGYFVDFPSATASHQLKIGEGILGQNINTLATSVLGFGIASSTSSRLTLAGGTTGISSLRITSGVAPTSPVDGDIWFDGTDIKMRIGGVTKTFTLV